jgi:DNA-directed RNA polymerase subunit RPC12/RpoP
VIHKSRAVFRRKSITSKSTLIGLLILLVSCTNNGDVQSVTKKDTLQDVGVVQSYKPKKLIDFPHDVHTGKAGIDCKYCHHSVNKSKTGGLPTVYLCANCHKTIKGRTPK